MNRTLEHEFAGDWAGLAVLERLSKTGADVSSEEIGAILGTKNVKGIGSALRQTRNTLDGAGIRFDETVSRRSVRRRTVWSGGPRIRQAIHVLEQERFMWTSRGRHDSEPVANVQSDHTGPVLVLRALKLKENAFRIAGGMPELDEILDDDWFDIGDDGYQSIGEIFVDRIEPGADGCEHPVPTGYGENGIWIRGAYDYAQPRVAGAIGTGRFPTMIACIGMATWIERRIALTNAVRQVQTVRAESGRLTFKDERARWYDVEEQMGFLYVRWLGTREVFGPRSAPPLRMRLRCWHEIEVETAARKRFVLREEGLRGDDERTVKRAVARLRKQNANEPVTVRAVRIAKRQPRPMPP